MCGIVGYVGKNSANTVLMNGLKKLEYRGYDSCGLATMKDQQVHILKTLKRVERLEELANQEEISHIGIGHTRWATHGGVSEKNAHPHWDMHHKFLVVHNGIIENDRELRKMLEENGYTFYSETDTEVIPNLLDYYDNGNLVETVKKVTEQLKGSFALGILSKDHPEELVATKRNSPLVLGIGEKENFIASDFSAILKYTNRICILENDEIALLKEGSIQLFAPDLSEEEVIIKEIQEENENSEKNGYEHFMLKEIHENAFVVKKTLQEYYKDGKLDLKLRLGKDDLQKVKSIHIIACGTAMHAGLNAKYWIEKFTRIPVNVEIASEFRYANPIINEDDLAIVISQSGETADTIACLELIQNQHIPYISVVNVKESTMDRMSERVLYTMAGPEIAVASTKAYIAQVLLLDLLAIDIAQKLGTYEADTLKNLLCEMMELPQKMDEILEKDSEFKAFAKEIVSAKDVFYLGRGLDYAIALEGSLKLKEISYIHAEAAPFGELKHGPIALIEENTPAIVIATNVLLLEKVVNNIKEIKARGAKVLAITTLQDFPEEMVDTVWKLPYISAELSPLEVMIPMQLLAYFVTIEKGLDVDKPRNLAKSVTVE